LSGTRSLEPNSANPEPLTNEQDVTHCPTGGVCPLCPALRCAPRRAPLRAFASRLASLASRTVVPPLRWDARSPLEQVGACSPPEVPLRKSPQSPCPEWRAPRETGCEGNPLLGGPFRRSGSTPRACRRRGTPRRRRRRRRSTERYTQSRSGSSHRIGNKRGLVLRPGVPHS